MISLFVWMVEHLYMYLFSSNLHFFIIYHVSNQTHFVLAYVAHSSIPRSIGFRYGNTCQIVNTLNSRTNGSWVFLWQGHCHLIYELADRQSSALAAHHPGWQYVTQRMHPSESCRPILGGGDTQTPNHIVSF